MSDESVTREIAEWLDDDPHDRSATALDSRMMDDRTVAIELLTHSMLVGSMESDAKRERRVQAVLEKFESRYDRPPESRERIWRRASSFAVAAAIMIGVGFWFTWIPLSADAAMSRVIRSIQDPVTRVYSVRIHSRRFGGDSVREGTLYSHGNIKMAVVFEGAIRSPAVIGSDGQRRWMVAGRSVWTSDAVDSSGGDPFRQRLIQLVTLGSMEINALLTQIPSSYEVRFLPSEPLPGQEIVRCHPIEATLVTPNRRLPQRIVIWSHPDTGVATKMQVSPNENRVRGASGMEFVLQEEQELPEDFFTPEFHRIDQ